MNDEKEGLSQEELDRESARELPEREEMSVIQGMQPTILPNWPDDSSTPPPMDIPPHTTIPQ